jgi:hypothetical protein
MATLAALLSEMADQIRTSIEMVTDIEVQVEPGMVLDPTPPTIDMYPSDLSEDPELAAFGEAFGGELITVRARVTTADNDAGQNLLLGFMDDEDELSIVQALDTDRTLNGLASTMDVRARSGYTLFPSASGDGVYLGFTLNVVVVKARS